jgi:hypothetical protein
VGPQVKPAEAAALLSLELLESERLPETATTWLEFADSPAVAELASRPSRSDPRELRDLLLEALNDLGVPRLDPRDAADVAKLYFARAVINGEIDPEAGASRIIYGIYLDHVDHTPAGGVWGDDWGISDLIGAYCQIGDFPPDSSEVKELRADIVAACDRIVREARY